MTPNRLVDYVAPRPPPVAKVSVASVSRLVSALTVTISVAVPDYLDSRLDAQPWAHLSSAPEPY